jgi:hypothetical protein
MLVQYTVLETISFSSSVCVDIKVNISGHLWHAKENWDI